MQTVRILRRFARDEQGVTAIEYALIAALVGVAIIVAATALGTNLAAVFNYVAGQLASAI